MPTISRLTLQGRLILQDINVHIDKGEIYGLLGPNGAGKSTTIAVLLGLYSPDGGELRLFDAAHTDLMAVRRRVGVMPEQAGFYAWMSAEGYLAWYASIYDPRIMARRSLSLICCAWWGWIAMRPGPSGRFHAACSSVLPSPVRWSAGRSC